MSRLRRTLIVIGCVVAAAALIGAIVVAVGKGFTAQEKEVRSDWSVETGDLLHSSADLGVNLFDAGIDTELRVLRLVPAGSNAVGFTYYDVETQNRLANAIVALQECGIPWTSDNPLAILNAFGTGANGLYLYFETDHPTTVGYTIHVDGLSDFSATANDIAVEGEIEKDGGGSRIHSFQMIGLVPGATNYVTMTVGDGQGNVEQTLTFSLDMPGTDSGYPTVLEGTEGKSDQPLSNGLYALMRTNGYLGYGFFFDNDGVMRYEMVTEGFGLDRMLMYEDETIVCTSTQAISRIDGLGRVNAVYDLGEYDLHHDINRGTDGTVVALAEKAGRETVEDVVIEVETWKPAR